MLSKEDKILLLPTPQRMKLHLSDERISYKYRFQSKPVVQRSMNVISFPHLQQTKGLTDYIDDLSYYYHPKLINTSYYNMGLESNKYFLLNLYKTLCKSENSLLKTFKIEKTYVKHYVLIKNTNRKLKYFVLFKKDRLLPHYNIKNY